MPLETKSKPAAEQSLWQGRGFIEILDEPLPRIGNAPNVIISKPPVEAFANGGKVWVAIAGETELAAHLDTPEAVDELIAALETAKQQAWPKVEGQK